LFRTVKYQITLAVASALLLTGTLPAQRAPKLASLAPEWIQRGTTQEIVLTGENLGEIREILFNGDAGLSATNIPPAPPPPKPGVSVESTGGGITRADPAAPPHDDKRVVLKVTASADASLFPRELRLVGPGGVSNPLNLNVGQWPELARREANTIFGDAQGVDLPAVISGAVSAGGQTNFYRFKAAKGQDLVFEVDAARRGSPLDSSLALLDAKGKELARNEDALGLDSLLFFRVPEDAEYVLALRDFRFRGGGDYAYRLTAGPIPYVESFYPFGGQRGKPVELSLNGYNLDGTTKLMLNIEAKARRNQEIRVKTPRGYSNLVPFDVTDLPEVSEAEPNNALTNAQALTVPALVNGRIGEARDVDHFKFKAASDQKLVCEVAAARFGSKLDALLVLMDDKGGVLQRNDDAAGADARIEFDAKKDTEYVLALRDLTDRGGERFGYRLIIRPPSAGAAASFAARCLPDAVRIHREGTAKIRCEITRNGGFDSPVRFTCEGLPTGVYAEPMVMPNTPHSGILMLVAPKEVPLGSFPIRVVASAAIGGKPVTVTAEPVSGDRAAKQAYLTVLDTVPFSVELTTLDVTLDQNQAGTVEVFASRREGFTGEIKVVAEGYSAGREPISKSFSGGETTIKSGETMGKISVTPKLDSEVGTRTIVIRGEATVEGRQFVTYSRPVPVSVAQYPLVLSSTLPRLSLAVLPPGSTSAAGEAETKIRVERRAGFNGEVELTLEGLPAGLTSELPKIPAGVGEVSLKLNATPTAAMGTNYNLTVVGTAFFNDRKYKTRTAPISMSVTPPEQAEIATNAPPAPPAAAAATGTK
jgi:hypothetical protein